MRNIESYILYMQLFSCIYCVFAARKGYIYKNYLTFEKFWRELYYNITYAYDY